MFNWLMKNFDIIFTVCFAALLVYGVARVAGWLP